MPPKDIQHAGKPQASVIPKSAMFLMRAEDRGSEDNADPTDGGQEGDQMDPGTAGADDGAPTAPELADAISQLVDQFGADAVRQACDEATSQEQGDMDEAGDGPAAAQDDVGGDGDGGGEVPRY